MVRKVKTYRGYVIASTGNGFYIYTKDEWECGAGCRYPEWECDSMQEAIDWIGDGNRGE